MQTTAQQQQLEAFLFGRYEASREYQQGEGRQFDLTWPEYLSLWKRKRYLLNKVRQQVVIGRANAFMASSDGIVLSWKSKDAFQDGVINVHSMEIKTKEMSKRVCHMRVGDHHSEASKEKIRAARTGTTRTDATKEAIRAAHTGSTRSEATKAKMAESARKRWARARAEKNDNN